jgi:hypothetical protein
MAKKQMKAVVQKNVNNYIFSAINLCIILAYDNLKPWFYENYIQLYYAPNKNGRYENSEKWLDFYGALTAPQEILEYDRLKKDFFKGIDIIRFIEDSIDDGYYIYTYYDEYYVKESYNKAGNHFVHDLLIYGYDSDNKVIMAIGYSDNRTFTRYEINYRDFEIAFESALELTKNGGWDDMAFYGLKMKNRFDENYIYSFDISKFLSRLYDYIHSVNTGKKDYPVDDGSKDLHYLYTLKDNVYGIDINDHIIEYVKSRIEGKLPLSYVIFHTLHEHKLCLIERLHYLAEEFHIPGIRELIPEYEKIVSSFNSIKLMVLKYNVKKRETLLNDIIKTLEPEKERERAVLEKAYELISGYRV